MDRLFLEVWNEDNWKKAIAKGVTKGIKIDTLRNLEKPEVRNRIRNLMLTNALLFKPPHMAQVEKDTPGEYRTVIVSEQEARVLDSVINDALFKVFPNRVHKRAKAYQIGLSTGKVGLEVTENIMKYEENHKDAVVLGGKYDFHAFFDTVSYKAIMELLDSLEDELGCEYGTEPVINYIRRTWASNYVFDLNKNLIEQYMGIRQGNAISAFLANAILYELDDYMSNKYEYYVRYSDDLIVFGEDVEKITDDINKIICKYDVTLNPKKIETLTFDKWFKFLGYTFKNNKRSLSQRRIKNFQKEVEKRTVNRGMRYDVYVKEYDYIDFGDEMIMLDTYSLVHKKANCKSQAKSFAKSSDDTIKIINATYEECRDDVYAYLYKGNGEFSPALQILKYVNSESDINRMNNFIMDCLRAVITGKKSIAGLGYKKDGNELDGVIPFNPGKNVASNRKKCPTLEGYYTIKCMQNALQTSKSAYDTIVRQM